jgi:hypothetical protein
MSIRDLRNWRLEDDLNKAWEKALQADMALLCAMPDFGPNSEPDWAWPARSREAVRIRGAVSGGYGLSQNLEDANEAFYFPEDATITTQSDNLDTVRGGTVATALAAGLAAIILRCRKLVEAGRLTLEKGPETSRERSFRSKSRFIKKAFSVIAHGATERGQLIPVWDILKLPESVQPSSGREVDLTSDISFLSDLVRRLEG